MTGTLRQVFKNGAEWRVRSFVASADVEEAFDGIRHQDMIEAVFCRKECVVKWFVRFCVNPLICKAESVSLELRYPQDSTLFLVLGRGVLRGPIWTTHCKNLQLAGRLKELASG